MNITNATGLTETQKVTLKALGAVETPAYKKLFAFENGRLPNLFDNIENVVVFGNDAEHRRYRMPETIHQFAQGQLRGKRSSCFSSWAISRGRSMLA
jgi:hypothetical protein